MPLFRTVVFLLVLVLSACNPGRITVAWKNDQLPAATYSTILVAAVIKDKDDSLRPVVEKEVTRQLVSLGYDAVPAENVFGYNNLAALTQEETYRILCNKGVDAVLTVALLPASGTDDLKAGGAKKYTSLYYYNHIWAYHSTGSLEGAGQLNWEMILFDLSQLRAQFVLQAGPFPAGEARIKVTGLSGKALEKLLKRNSHKVENAGKLKPF